jgi:hypothetical protein
VALAPKRLSGPTQLTAAAVQQYAAPGGTTTKITEILWCNASAADRTVTAHLVPSGGAVGNANMIYNAINIPAGQTVKIACATILGAGDAIHAFASAAATVNMAMSGNEMT